MTRPGKGNSEGGDDNMKKRMNKDQAGNEPSAPAVGVRDTALTNAAADAAIRALGAADAMPQARPEVRLLVRDGQPGLLSDLQERCLKFGIRPSNDELIDAGLLLLTQLTETALEVALLQSLRADRSSTPRSRHRS